MNNAVTQTQREYRSLWVILAYVLLCLALLPAFREIIDPDDTNYLKIAERYASGNWRQAVNGMWSPLNSWLGAVFLSPAHRGILVFKYLNIGIGIVALLSVRGLLQLSGLSPRHFFPALAGLLPFALYATYHELAADWLQCTLILLYLNLIFSPRYPERFIYPLLCGLLGALAYYAKYYNFHFFWLHFLAANVCWLYRRGDKAALRRFRLYLLSGLAVLLLAVLPWIFLLHMKYGFWKLNYTGVYDLAWSLDPGIVSRHARALLVPALPGSPSYLEDPIWLRHELVTPFSGMHYLLRQAGVSALSVASFLESLSFFSVLLPVLLGICIFRFFSRRAEGMTFDRSAALVMMVLPLGYFMFHVEPRFIWPLFLLGYIFGYKLLVADILPLVKPPLVRALLWCAVLLTCAVHPLLDLSGNLRRDDQVSRWTEALAPLQLHGTFVTNEDQNKMIRFAYLNGMSLAVHTDQFTEAGLVDDLTDKKVNYYFEFASEVSLLPAAIRDQLAEIPQDKVPGLKIYRLYGPSTGEQGENHP